MPMEIQFQGGAVSVKTRKVMHDYFHFPQIYRIVLDDTYQYRQALESSSLKCLLDRDMLGENHKTGLLDLLQTPEKFLERLADLSDGAPWIETTESGSLRIRTAAFAHQCSLYFQDIMDVFERGEENFLSDNGDYSPNTLRNSVQNAADRLTNHGLRLFSPEKAMYFTLFFYLHLQSGITEFRDEDISFMERELLGGNYAKESIFSFPEQSGVLELPLFRGARTLSGNMEIVRIENHPDWYGQPGKIPAKTVRIEGTPLRRFVRPNECVYALRVNGQYIGFLPRFSQSGRLISYPQKGKLYHEAGDDSFFAPIGTKAHPVSWAHSNEYGSLLADDLGKLDETMLYKTPALPERRIVRVKANGSDYGILFEDGSGRFGIRKRGWDCILDFSLSLNSGIAINSLREVILEDGRKIASGYAALCDCAEKRFLWMDMSGQAHTDTGLEKSVRTPSVAAAVCNKGYILSGAGERKGIIDWYDFQNRLVRSFHVSEQEINELSADGETVAWFENSNGTVQRLTIE